MDHFFLQSAIKLEINKKYLELFQKSEHWKLTLNQTWEKKNRHGKKLTWKLENICFFIQFMGFSWLVYWSGLPLPPPVDHILSELSTMICPFYVALHGMAHSFTELCKPLHHDKAVIHEGASSLDAIYSCSIITFPWSRPSLRK